MHLHTEKGGLSMPTSRRLQCTCCLQDDEILELVGFASTSKTTTAAHGYRVGHRQGSSFPDNLFIVQARPETVWSQRKAASILGHKTGRQLLLEQAMKRIRTEDSRSGFDRKPRKEDVSR